MGHHSAATMCFFLSAAFAVAGAFVFAWRYTSEDRARLALVRLLANVGFESAVIASGLRHGLLIVPAPIVRPFARPEP